MIDFLWRHRSTLMIFAMAVLGVLVFADPAMAEEGEGGDGFFSRSMFILKSAGVFLILLAVPSIALIALCVMLLLDLRMSVAIPPGFVDEFIDIVNKRKFKEAFDMARGDTSMLGRVLTAGMSRLQYGLEDAREAAMNMLESIRSGKEFLNAFTAVIGTLGPLIGIVGTVWGMIGSFRVLGSSSGPINPAKLSEGISEALSITVLGIFISLPAIIANAFFRNRIVGLSQDVGHIADDLLTQMYHNSKKAGTPSTTMPAPATGGSPPPPPPPK